MLENIHSPRDLDKLSYDQLEQLAKEIREVMITTVSENGGHLASNLGVVELTLALHRVFRMPEDKIVFDVGHQSYVHKLITGRYDRFSTLRSYGGISGFPKRSESEYDCFETGHASTAISAALGLARARDFRKEKYQVIAVVGDGALTGGMCYEALNDAGNSKTRMIVILNDNEMSIAPNVGALSNYLTQLRISGGWQSAKSRIRHLRRIPLVGRPMYRMIHGTKQLLRTAVVKDTGNGFFEALGFEYFGPINGHDPVSMEKAFRQGRCIAERDQFIPGPDYVGELVEEPFVDLGQFVDAVYGPTKHHGLGYVEDTGVGGIGEGVGQVLHFVGLVAHEAVGPLAYHPEALLDGLLEGEAYGHHLADRLHACADLAGHSVELAEIPTRDLAHDILHVRLVECALGAACILDLGQFIAETYLGGDECEGITCGLGGQG